MKEGKKEWEDTDNPKFTFKLLVDKGSMHWGRVVNSPSMQLKDDKEI